MCCLLLPWETCLPSVTAISILCFFPWLPLYSCWCSSYFLHFKSVSPWGFVCIATACWREMFLNAYEFKIGLIFMEDSVQRTFYSKWWAAQRRKERRKAPSMSCSVSLKLSSDSFQTLLPSVYLRGQLITREKFYGGKTNILYPYPFPSAECWLHVALSHAHPLKGGGSSLCCPMMYSAQCQGWLMFLVCMDMPVLTFSATPYF